MIRAAVSYFALVFGTGFVLGIGRVLWLVPRLGTRGAELLEMPVMLVAIVLAARWTNRRLARDAEPTVRLAVGLTALACLLGAEVALGVGLRGVSAWQALADRDPVSGTVYYLLLGVFGLMPWLLASGSARRS